MLDQNDLKLIEGTVERVVSKSFDEFGKAIDTRFEAVDKRFDEFGKAIDSRFEEFARIVNLSFADVQKELLLIHKRIDMLSSHVDEFINLHRKLDQELTMMRARLERMEEQLQQLQARFA